MKNQGLAEKAPRFILHNWKRKQIKAGEFTADPRYTKLLGVLVETGAPHHQVVVLFQHYSECGVIVPYIYFPSLRGVSCFCSLIPPSMPNALCMSIDVC